MITRRPNRRIVHRSLATIVCAGLALFGLIGLPGFSATSGPLALGSQPVEAQSSQLRLIAQTPYVPADGSLGLVLGWAGPVGPDIIVSAQIFGAITDEASISAAPTTDTLNRYPSPQAEPLSISTLIGDDGLVRFDIPVRSFSAADDRVLISEPGVYPVVVEVRTLDGPISSVRTHLIRLPTETAEIVSLPTNVVLNVSSADGLELREVIPILERHPSMPVLVVLEEGVIPQLETDPELSEAFRIALAGRTTTAVPDLDLDPSALAEIGQGQLYQAALDNTKNRLIELGFSVDETILPLDTGLTRTGARMLSDLGIEIVIEFAVSSTSGGSVEVGEGLRVLTIDQRRTLQMRSSDDNDAVLRAHQLLAALAVRQQNDRSPIVIGGDELRSVDIDALEVLLGALEQPGLVEAVDVNTATGSGSAIPLRVVERPEQDLGFVEEDLDELLAAMDTYRDFYVAGGISPDLFDDGVIASLTRALNQDERAREIGRLQALVDEQLNVISMPDGQSITLAARTASVPLAVSNDGLGTRQVLLRFESDRIGVEGGDRIVQLATGQSTIEVEVEAKSLGLSPLAVEVWTSDGTRQLAETQYRVRSTAIPGLGYLLSGTALVFLIAWWLLSISRSRSAHHDTAAQQASQDRREDENLEADSAHRTSG